MGESIPTTAQMAAGPAWPFDRDWHGDRIWEREAAPTAADAHAHADADDLEERVAALEARVDEQVLEWRIAAMEYRLGWIIQSAVSAPEPREPERWPPATHAPPGVDTRDLEERVAALDARLDEQELEWRIAALEHRLGQIMVCLDELREWREELGPRPARERHSTASSAPD